jgi:transcriptional regulator with XRE-family HTH domain
MTIKHAYSGPDTLGDRLRWARERIGMSAAQLGRDAEYQGSTSIYRIEVGQTKSPRTDVLTRIARVLGVRVEWLVDGSLPISRLHSLQGLIAILGHPGSW